MKNGITELVFILDRSGSIFCPFLNSSLDIVAKS